LYIKTDNKLYIKNSSGTEGAVTSDLVGATSSAAGTAGLVPAPAAGDQERFLTGGASFSNDFIPNNPSPAYDTTPTYFITGTPSTFVTGFNNVIYLLPIFIPKRVVNPTIYFRCTGHSVAGTQGVKALIYSDSGSLPYSLLYNSGEIVIAQSAANYTHTTSSLTLTRGIYWTGLVRSATNMGFLSVAAGSNTVFNLIFGLTEDTSFGRVAVGHDSSYTTPASTLPTAIRAQNTGSAAGYLALKSNEAIWVGIR
jgi:hypothetical protein